MSEPTSKIQTLDRLTDLDTALDLALEATKLGITVEQLLPMVRSMYACQALGIQLGANESFWDWGIRIGVIPKLIGGSKDD